jgi:ABC-type transport system involved in resistance to organic solvents, periplasmic component
VSKMGGAGFQPVQRLLTVLAFVALCTGLFAFFWINSGGKIPLVSQESYRTTVVMPKVDNVVYFSDISIAGVKIGKVQEIQELGDRVRVVMEIDQTVAPLHEGATVQVRAKSLIQESFLEVTDGTGPALPDGSTLPEGSGMPTTQVYDILRSLDQETIDSLGGALHSSALATDGGKDSISAAVGGLGALGRQGKDALDALAEQSADLTELTGNATTLLAALNTREGQIAQLVDDSAAVTMVTADGAPQLEAAMRRLPPLLDTARESSDDLRELAGSLAPVAENLAAAAPDLNAALVELRPTARDLRSMMPALDGTLDKAPATLDRVPAFTDELRGVIPDAETVLADLNPMLGYLQPYGPDIANFFVNFGETLSNGDVNGQWIYVGVIFNEQSFKGSPVNTNVGPLDKFNPLPAAGSANDPGREWVGPYPRVDEEAPPG